MHFTINQLITDRCKTPNMNDKIIKITAHLCPQMEQTLRKWAVLLHIHWTHWDRPLQDTCHLQTYTSTYQHICMYAYMACVHICIDLCISIIHIDMYTSICQSYTLISCQSLTSSFNSTGTFCTSVVSASLFCRRNDFLAGRTSFTVFSL